MSTAEAENQVIEPTSERSKCYNSLALIRELFTVLIADKEPETKLELMEAFESNASTIVASMASVANERDDLSNMINVLQARAAEAVK